MAGLPGGPSGENEELLSEINVTPFVDVVLVLLVIFIVMAPAIVKNTLGIKLPQAASSDASAAETLGIAVTEQGQILVNGAVTTPEALTEQIRQLLARSPEAQAIISADENTRHRDLVRAIDLVKSAGLSRFALQVERAESPPEKRE